MCLLAVRRVPLYGESTSINSSRCTNGYVANPGSRSDSAWPAMDRACNVTGSPCTAKASSCVSMPFASSGRLLDAMVCAADAERIIARIVSGVQDGLDL